MDGQRHLYMIGRKTEVPVKIDGMLIFTEYPERHPRITGGFHGGEQAAEHLSAVAFAEFFRPEVERRQSSVPGGTSSSRG